MNNLYISHRSLYAPTNNFWALGSMIISRFLVTSWFYSIYNIGTSWVSFRVEHLHKHELILLDYNMVVHCSLVVTCCKEPGLLALLYMVFSCVFVTFSCGVLCQVWYLIVSIPDICLLSYFVTINISKSESFFVSEKLINHNTYQNTSTISKLMKLLCINTIHISV